MPFSLEIESPPLREDSSGALRIGDSRVLLELVIRAFEDGATPETVVQRYPSLSLPDVYAVIAYFLRHRDQIEQYMKRRELDAQEAATLIQQNQRDISDLRQRLAARRQSNF